MALPAPRKTRVTWQDPSPGLPQTALLHFSRRKGVNKWDLRPCALGTLPVTEHRSFRVHLSKPLTLQMKTLRSKGSGSHSVSATMGSDKNSSPLIKEGTFCLLEILVGDCGVSSLAGTNPRCGPLPSEPRFC